MTLCSKFNSDYFLLGIEYKCGEICILLLHHDGHKQRSCWQKDKVIFHNFPIKLHLKITDNNEECSLLKRHMRTCPLMLNQGSQPINTRLSGEPWWWWWWWGGQTLKKKKKNPPNVHVSAREWCVLSDLPGISFLLALLTCNTEAVTVIGLTCAK